MAMNSKRNPQKVDEDKWASDESLDRTKRSPGRPRKIKSEEKKNVQLRLPVSLINDIDSMLDGESRHTWIIKAIKRSLR